MALVMRSELSPFLSDENGHISMRDARRNWLVIVTREALEDVAEPADASLERLLEFAKLFGEVATFKLDHGRAGEEDTIWIQSDDVRQWQFLQSDKD
jgi:hypothetical protein